MALSASILLNDPALAFLAPAFQPDWMAPRLEEVLGRSLTLQAIRLLRHKPGRRCLIAYDVALADDAELITMLGKVRSRGLDHHSYKLQSQLWQAGFDQASPDGVSVPEPLGVMPELNLWLQRWVPGEVATALLPQDVGLAERIAGAIAKLHQTNLPARRHHTPHDEMRILQERLPRLGQTHPQWQGRIEQVLQASADLAEMLPQTTATGIHRDFYPDQVLVRGDRIYLLDLDLYCQGDPALDIGNFIAHMSEQSLRTSGHPDQLTQQEEALVETCFDRNPDLSPAAIETYKTLTLVRHIYISTQFCDRRATTARLLDLCEARLDL